MQPEPQPSTNRDLGYAPGTLPRRDFLKAAALAGAALGSSERLVLGQDKGARPGQSAEVAIVNPCGRVPLSFIIDDSTCLVNMAHFGIPQFAEVFPENYKQDWRKLPREIPDAFVRKFGQWCHEHGVKGKYSIVPYPACVGWMDRGLPGWSKRELDESLALVRELMMPDWDIHPEMVSHTRVIDTKTGRPYPEPTPYFMENWRWTDGKSVDQLADYMSYALRILKNVGLDCEGITTPGGFGNRVLPELSQATLESCRDVFGAEIPHYFRHLFTDERSVAPRVEYASGLDGADPKCVVSIIGCTGDWFGGWDGLVPGSVDRFITEDLQSGRLPEVIARGEPAILVCHWPGIYYNGEEIGFNIFKEVVRRVHARYDDLIWMKLSEIARYWAAKELTEVRRQGSKIALQAPFATPHFTLRIEGKMSRPPVVERGAAATTLEKVGQALWLKSGTWCESDDGVMLCFDLSKGHSTVVM
ncbi:MAG: twin-arginine translocation signal domain-containing protein [Phycisphaerales bacterium]|nr:MAG: twin-arginine translocation signal domain-containing protein [Phycisphaerales bacterium]